METTYGVGVKNRYQLFDDDEDDPLDILRKQEEENRKLKLENLSKPNKGKGTKQPPVSKGSKDVLPKGKSNVESGLNKPRLTKPGPDRNVRFSNSTQDEPKESEEKRNYRNRDDRLFSDTREQRGDSEIRRRGGGGMRGPRGGRGRGRGGVGFDNRGKREFDRQSGSDKSGVKPVEKREGAGAHNWGTVKDDLDVQLTPLSDENPEAGERSGDEVPLEQADVKEGESGNDVKSTNESSSNEMTLDEWKKQQAGIRSKASFNLRKAGEGEDSNQWKKCYVLKKKLEDDDEEEEEDDDSEDDDENSRRGRQKQYVDIKINFADSRRARGRGRGRGIIRGGPRGTKSAEQSVPKVDDWNDFPSLIAA